MSGTPTSSTDLASQHPAAQLPWLTSRRCLLGLLVAVTTLAGAFLMLRILEGGGLTPLRGGILILFTLTFAWIALAFWSAVFGLVVAALEATSRSLIDTGEAHHFEAFVLSDTTDTDIAEDEGRQIAELQQRLKGDLTLHYRRRTDNRGRKAGNIAEFCRRWGRRYDFMVVLDADSRMEGKTLLALVRAMQARPSVGLIQTVPLPARQITLFGRLAEFAASLYAPILAAGQSSWQGDTANYWGHNAILRVSAFMDHGGLPVLPGRPPLGGEILSHDFVEAALLRRGGWEVQLEARIRGSFEEMPGNLLDFARRDRRWTQGNLQHLRLLDVPELHGMNRLHFLLGAMAFLSSLLWLGVLVAGSLDAMLHSPQ
ncbi:glucans biosynthesis glucosyltransferase MdoH, partial [Halomonas sp.]|uniref:glucans biosynthesis glucosyltransferase MdoH n=1 Tax=Halomonas sp. TaxID=1486246 RepID=UPI003564AC1E